MPRPRNSYLFNLFKTNEQNQMVCYNGGCGGRLLYRHSANLERHLRKIHPVIYSHYMTKKKVLKFPRKVNMEKRLIDLVRGYPVLWDKSQNHSFNEELDRKAWEEINREMKIYLPSMTVDMCKQKWNAITEKFIHEYKKTPQLPVAGGQANKIWKYFSDLLFLRDQVIEPKAMSAAVQNEPENHKVMEIMLTECIKEESNESFLLAGATVEESTAQDESQISLKVSTKGLADTDSDENDGEYGEDSIPDQGAKIKTTRPQKRPLYTYSEDDDDDDDNFNETNNEKQRKKKSRLLSEKENLDTSENDPDKMFLLSLLPFLKTVAANRKLLVRHSLQGVLLEEEQQQQRQKQHQHQHQHQHQQQQHQHHQHQQQQHQQQQYQQPHPPALNNLAVFAPQEFVDVSNTILKMPNHIT